MWLKFGSGINLGLFFNLGFFVFFWLGWVCQSAISLGFRSENVHFLGFS